MEVMDATKMESYRINVEILESGAKLVWCEFIPKNDTTFQNVVKRIEEMERHGWGL